jgi:microsomal prostaglandin-E synthase 2
MPESLDSFRYFSDVGDWQNLFPTWERVLVIYAGASVMWLIGKRLKKRHLLKDDVRESFYDACRQWTKAVGKERQFMGGSNPNLADLAVFGVLNSIEGCAAFDDALKHTNIGKWYFAVKDACKTNRGQSEVNF